MHNVKPQRKNQDSANKMDNMFLRDLFAYATNFTQSQIALQLSRIFYKSTFFCKTKPNLKMIKWT